MTVTGGGAPDGAPDGDDATLEQVLAHGGWLLVDPRPYRERNPDDFWLPPAADLEALAPGSAVRAMFRCADLADDVRDRSRPYVDGVPQLVLGTERMWLVVLERDGDHLTCVLDSMPWSAYSRLRRGAVVTIPTTHVIDTADGPGSDLEEYLSASDELGFPRLPEAEATAPEDAMRRPTVRENQDEVCRRADVWPEPTWIFGRMLAARDLGPDREPVHGVRFEARPDQGDSGWMVFAGYDSLEAVQDGPGFEVVTVQEAWKRDPRIFRYLALPEGWGFTSGSRGDDVYRAEVE